MTVSAGLAALLSWPVQFLWWMSGSVAELLQGWVLSGWSGAGLVPPCSDHQPSMSNETLQTRARNILIEISQWSILCLHCVRYWVPITGNAGHYTLHSPAHTWHGDIPSGAGASYHGWTYISSYLTFCYSGKVKVARLPDSPISNLVVYHSTAHIVVSITWPFLMSRQSL